MNEATNGGSFGSKLGRRNIKETCVCVCVKDTCAVWHTLDVNNYDETAVSTNLSTEVGAVYWHHVRLL